MYYLVHFAMQLSESLSTQTVYNARIMSKLLSNFIFSLYITRNCQHDVTSFCQRLLRPDCIAKRELDNTIHVTLKSMILTKS